MEFAETIAKCLLTGLSLPKYTAAKLNAKTDLSWIVFHSNREQSFGDWMFPSSVDILVLTMEILCVPLHSFTRNTSNSFPASKNHLVGLDS